MNAIIILTLMILSPLLLIVLWYFAASVKLRDKAHLEAINSGEDMHPECFVLLFGITKIPWRLRWKLEKNDPYWRDLNIQDIGDGLGITFAFAAVDVNIRMIKDWLAQTLPADGYAEMAVCKRLDCDSNPAYVITTGEDGLIIKSVKDGDEEIIKSKDNFFSRFAGEDEKLLRRKREQWWYGRATFFNYAFLHGIDTQLVGKSVTDINDDFFSRFSGDTYEFYGFDTECVIDDDIYAMIFERLAALSKGAFSITNVYSRVDHDSEKAFISFTYNDVDYRWDLTYRGDWFDCDVIGKINSLLKDDGSANFFFTSSPDQIMTVVFGSEEDVKKLNLQEPDWPFTLSFS